MDLSPTWILMFLGFWAGLMDSIVGGGGLISLPAFLSVGLGPMDAIATNKLVGIASASSSSLHYVRKKTFVRERLLIMCVVCFFSAMLGSSLTTQTSPTLLRRFILVALFAVAIYSLCRPKLGAYQSEPKSYRGPAMIISSLLLGMYDGFFGPGTGTFMIIALLYFCGSSLLQAASTGRIMNLATNAGSLVLFSYLGLVHYSLAIPAALCSMVGGVIGSRYATRYGSKGIRPVFFLSVFLLLMKLVYDTFF